LIRAALSSESAAKPSMTSMSFSLPGRRSVFYDLGFDEADARVLKIRADLMAALDVTASRRKAGLRTMRRTRSGTIIARLR
jgi:hypothetical protein